MKETRKLTNEKWKKKLLAKKKRFIGWATAVGSKFT